MQANHAGSAGTDNPLQPTNSSNSYSRDRTTLNQTPSSPLLLDDPDLLAVPDVPPPSYEEATAGRPSAGGGQPQPQPQRRPIPSMPGAYPVAQRPVSFGGGPNPAGLQAPPATGRRASATNAYPPPSLVSTTPDVLPSFGGGGGNGGDTKRPALPTRPQNTGASGSGSAPPPLQPAPGSVPRCQQFPPVFNLYGDGLSHRLPTGEWGQQYWIGEHQHQPLYAVELRTGWGGGRGMLYNVGQPVLVVRNGPSAHTAPVLAAVRYGPGLAEAADITLPPPLTYRGRGSTAVRLDLVYGWSHAYRFAMEVGTSLSGVRIEAFEWRHSVGSAVAALGGARDGWKLVRCSAGVGAAAAASQGRVTSDGHEVVAVMADARMSLTKHLKFAFAGTGRTGVLGERWAVMAVTSALVVWEKELGMRQR